MWQIMLCVGVVALIIEIFAPTLFFLNFSIAGFICAILAYFVHSTVIIITVFCILSLLLLLVLRPVLLKIQSNIKQNTGMEAKYIGKTAKVAEDVDKTKGKISIYDELWQARNIEDDVIPAGSVVEIVDYESIVLMVKKV